MKNNKLTIKELRFVEEYVSNGFNGSKAYRSAYETSNSKLSKAEAWKMLRMLKIQDAITASEKSYRHMAREMQMDRKSVLLELRNMIKGKNSSAKEKLAGINTLCKLLGDFAPQKQELQIEHSSGSVDVSKLTGVEIIELRDKILAEMC